MTQKEFSDQMARLVAQFGKATYTAERNVLIWEAVGALEATAFRRIVDKLIGEFRMAPLLPEIREMVARERERNWEGQKREHTRDALDFWESSYHPEEVKIIVQTIRARIAGQVSDEHWTSFMKGLDTTVSANQAKIRIGARR